LLFSGEQEKHEQEMKRQQANLAKLRLDTQSQQAQQMQTTGSDAG
jgi:hypothetical protein